MKSIPKSYSRAFDKYAQSTLEDQDVQTVTHYAVFINSKANDLVIRARKNNVRDQPLLQKELFETGRNYVHKFISRLKHEKEIQLKIHELTNTNITTFWLSKRRSA